MLKIELVRINGRLVGRTVSDRWNLWTLGLNYIPYERNQKVVKRLRRALTEFAFVMIRGGQLETEPTPAECEALGRVSRSAVA